MEPGMCNSNKSMCEKEWCPYYREAGLSCGKCTNKMQDKLAYMIAIQFKVMQSKYLMRRYTLLKDSLLEELLKVVDGTFN